MLPFKSSLLIKNLKFVSSISFKYQGLIGVLDMERLNLCFGMCWEGMAVPSQEGGVYFLRRVSGSGFEWLCMIMMFKKNNTKVSYLIAIRIFCMFECVLIRFQNLTLDYSVLSCWKSDDLLPQTE